MKFREVKITGKLFPWLNIRQNTVAEAEAFPQTDANIRSTVMRLTADGGVALVSFLFAATSAAFSTYPFAVSFIGSLPCYVPAAYFGAIMASIFNKGLSIPLFVLYTVQLALRIFISRSVKSDGSLFKESIKQRIIMSTLCSLSLSLYRLISDNFLFYDMFGAVFLMLATPTLTYLFSLSFGDKTDNGGKYEIGIFALGFSLCYSLSGVSLLGLNTATVLAFLAVCAFSYTAGSFKGCAAGLMCGAAVSPSLSLALGLSGLSFGFFVGNKLLSLVISCLVCILITVYTQGSGDVLKIIPELMIAASLFIPLSLKLKASGKYTGSELLDKVREQELVSRQINEQTKERLSAISNALSSLSQTFFQLSDKRRRPGPDEVRAVCEVAFEKNCRKCRKYSECWSKEYISTGDVQIKLSELLYSAGRVNISDVPKFMLSRCPNIEEIIDELNYSNTDLLQRKLEGNKAEIFALDYEQMSKLLSHAIIENDIEYIEDKELSDKLRKYLNYMRIFTDYVSVVGKRRKCITAYGVELSGFHLSCEELRVRLQKICGVEFKTPCFSIDRDSVVMNVLSERKFKVTSAVACASKEVCINGDVFSVFENKQDYFYALLSDGMGSGKEAAFTSRLSGLFLKKMLEAGNKKSISIEMLNTVLRQKGIESSATLDLLEIDLINGSASFIKSGAAPSFILREGRIFNVSTNSMPLGIVKEINAEEIKLDLRQNDIIVMFSDGIAPSFEDGVWIADLLTYELEKKSDLKTIADKVLVNAHINSARTDDMTVGILQILGRES